MTRRFLAGLMLAGALFSTSASAQFSSKPDINRGFDASIETESAQGRGELKRISDETVYCQEAISVYEKANGLNSASVDQAVNAYNKGADFTENQYEAYTCEIYFELKNSIQYKYTIRSEALANLAIIMEDPVPDGSTAGFMVKAIVWNENLYKDYQKIHLALYLSLSFNTALRMPSFFEYTQPVGNALDYVLNLEGFQLGEFRSYFVGQLARSIMVNSTDARVKWAQTLLNLSRNDPGIFDGNNDKELGARAIAISEGLVGDWPASAKSYRRLLKERDYLTGFWTKKQEEDGLLGFVFSPQLLPTEAAISFAMAGDAQGALDVLASDQKKLPLARQRLLSPEPSLYALTSYFGTAIIGYGEGQQFQPTVLGYHRNITGNELAVATSGIRGQREGIVDLYLRATDVTPPMRTDQALELFDSASSLTESTIGRAVRDAAWKLNLKPEQNLRLVLSGSVAVFPIGASKPVGGVPLNQQYRLRMIPLLLSLNPKTPFVFSKNIAFVRGDADLDFLGFEEDMLKSWGAKSIEYAGDGLASMPENMTIWHFSSHATYSPGMGAGIVLGPGVVMTIDEIENAEMRSPPRLVILAGCQTGALALNQDVYDQRSLATAFIKKGVEGVIVSQWPINDTSTVLLMAYFYEQLSRGRQPGDALFDSQAWLRTATREELMSYVNALFNARRLSRTAAGSMSAILAVNPEDRPFQHPRYWSSLQFFGS